MPVDGWHYEQPLPAGGTQRIPPRGCAGNDGELLKQVKQFRANIGVSLDNVEIDIAGYLKVHSPINDKYPGRTRSLNPPQRKARPIKPLIERIRDWQLVMAPKQPRLLIEDDAKTRAGVCARCPQNIEWKTGCLPCCDEIIQRGRHLRQRVDYPYADSLRACRLHGFYLPAAVFVDIDKLGDPHPDAPEVCWMKTEPRHVPVAPSLV